MITSRRSFIAGIAAAFAAPAIVKASSLMPVTGGIITRPVLIRSGISLLTINQITREAVKLFRNSNKFIQAIDKEYDFAEDGERIGSTLRIRLPEDFKVEDHWMTFNMPAQEVAFFKAHMPFAEWEKGLKG